MISGAKRLTALCLALILAFGLIFVPVYADETDGMAMSIVFTDTNFDPISIAKEGQTIYIGIKIENYKPLCAYSWRFDYNPELIEFDSDYNYSEKVGPATIAYFTNGVYKLSDLSPSTTNIDKGVAIANFAKEINVESLADGIAFYLAFTVKSTGQITADFNRENYGNFTWRTASVDDNSKYTDINTTETDGKLNVVSTGVSLSQYEVTVDGLKGASVNATAFDASVNDVTSSVTWSVEPQTGGVSINGGTITVDAKAESGNYTITATGNDGVFGEGQNSASAVLSVARAGSVPSKIQGKDPGESFDPNLEIPADNAADKTVQFSINVWDQYGDLIENPSVKWELIPSDVPGVSLSNNGLLTITNEAKASIDTTGTEFTINAYCGGLGPVTTKVTVKRADSAAASVAIYKDGNVVTSDSITVPTGDTSNTVTYTAKVLDQYGSPMDGARVTWSNNNSLNGVAVTDGNVTVAKGAATGNFTLTAASGNISTPLTVNVVTIAFTGQDTAVSAVDNPIYGMTWGKIIKVNDSAISAKVGETPVEGTYSVENAETIPDAGDNAEYSVLFTSNDGNYVGVEVARGTIEIAKKPVTVSGITASNKVYDGNTSATIETSGADISGIVSGDAVTIDASKAAGTFDTKNVGNGKTVTITGIALGGADKDNYTLTSGSATATADITAKTVTVSGITASDKEYDGNTSATIETSGAVISDIVSNDDVTIDASKAAGTFDTKNVGTEKTVTITGIALGGADKDNYTLSSGSATATADITASSNITDTTNKTQTVVVGVGSFTEPTFTGVTVDGVAETVDGTVTYTIGDASGMNYTQAVAALAQKTKEDNTVEVGYSFTASDSNYVNTPQAGTIIVTMVDIVFEIDEGAITVDANPVYGATWREIVTVDGSKITAKVGDDIVTGGTYIVKDASVMPTAGTGKTWEVQFIGSHNNHQYYNVTVKTGTVDVAQRELEFTSSANNKIYDGNDYAGLYSAGLIGVCGQDVWKVNANWDTVKFSDKNVGENKVVYIEGIYLEGEAAENYKIDESATTTATISPKSVTINGVTAENKTYDGNKTATIATAGTISDIISGDNVTIVPGTGTFASADVGTGITVTFSGFSLTGDDSSNYTLSAQPANTTADITKAEYTGTPNTVNVNILINQSAAQTGSVSLEQFFQTVPAGAEITEVETQTNSVIDTITISEDGKSIAYSSEANLTAENVTDTYIVTITTMNYNDITATLTFTTVAKTPVNISGVSVTGAGKTYDGRAVSYSGTPVAKTNDGTEVTVTGTYSYVWQTADGAVLSAAPKDAGSYKLIVTLDDPAYIGSTEVSFTIAKAKITIKANDAEAYTGSDMPKFSYTVTGLASGEKLAKEPSFSCAADMKKASNYTIIVSGAEVPNTANYEEVISYVYGILSVRNRPANLGPTYAIKVIDSAHGTVRASLGNASEGSMISLVVTPDEGYSLANLIVRDERGDRINVTKSGGVYTFWMPAGAVTVEATFAKGVAVLPFNDVSTYDWFYDYVKFVYENGIMDGVDTGVFGPYMTTTRAMLVTMLYRVAGEPYVGGANEFADVAANTWYTSAVAWASGNGIVTGVDVGVFNPNGAITREQLATILYRYAAFSGRDVSARASLSRFVDAGSVSAYAGEAMAWAVAEGILDGRTATELAPTGECTRAEVATMIARAFG